MGDFSKDFPPSGKDFTIPAHWSSSLLQMMTLTPVQTEHESFFLFVVKATSTGVCSSGAQRNVITIGSWWPPTEQREAETPAKSIDLKATRDTFLPGGLFSYFPTVKSYLIDLLKFNA